MSLDALEARNGDLGSGFRRNRSLIEMEPDQEQVAQLTALVRKTREFVDILDEKLAEALTELRLVVDQALNAGANRDLFQELSGLEISECDVERFRAD